jgi:hypothetical protein
MIFDVCVIGPVARDINAIGRTEYPPQPGGAAHLCDHGLCRARAARRGGHPGRGGGRGDTLLGELHTAGVEVFNLPSVTATTFHNLYDPQTPAGRRQRVDAIAPPIGVRDLPAIAARAW